ncbi:MAG: TRAP transporter small permease [Pseudomonadota bacterium]
MIERSLRASRVVSRWLVSVASVLILGSAILVTVEVVLRKSFNISIGGADELSGYAFGIATAFGMAQALHDRAHIRVDALYLLLPRWLKLIANFLGIGLLTGFAGMIAWTASDLVSDTLTHWSHSITPLRTPLAYAQVPWLIGWLIFVLTGIVILLAAANRLRAGDHRKVDELIGVKSVEEQIEDESS